MNKYFKGKLRIEAIQEIETIEPKNFSTDSWATIVAAVKSGNTDLYNVGDTKDIDLGELGTHKVRIANKEEPEECADPNFSQTACGFVLEFTDILFTSGIDDFGKRNGLNWGKSYIREYINGLSSPSPEDSSLNVYNHLPEDLKRGILTTRVISGGEYCDKSNNSLTYDKLYLLSSREVYEGGILSEEVNYCPNYHDAAYLLTRQLDYYKNNEVKYFSNYSGAIKNYQGEPTAWWLRTAYTANVGGKPSGNFIAVAAEGQQTNFGPAAHQGISPAFRIG